MKPVLLALTFAVVGLLGCAKKSAQSSPNLPPLTGDSDVGDRSVPSAPNAPVPTGDEDDGEREADFFPISDETFEEYVGRPLNSPEKFRIMVNVQKMWNDNYGGQVQITYYDNGVKRSGIFSSGDREDDIKYNEWFNYMADETFRGYFSDTYGAIIVVVDDVVDFGDGGGDDILAGRVYYSNFEPTRSPQSPTRCWNIEYGPYACGAEFTGLVPGDVVNHDYPGKTYKLLGTFKGLVRSKAFNTSYNP